MAANVSQRIIELARIRLLLRATDVLPLGGTSSILIKLHQAGRLRRVARGVYSLPDREPMRYQDLAQVCQRIPKAVICLLSALQFHEIGTQLPRQVWIALPEGATTPAATYPPIRIARLRGAAYSEGIETVISEGMPIRVYGVAKTITDCFKFRNKIGLDAALEAMKDAWRERKFTMSEATHYARINRVERVMHPYLEAMVA